jgi:carbon-monoxide dehydrogenase small subunit
MAKRLYELDVNGERYEVATEVNRTLLDVLRDDIQLTGSKKGCDSGDCGACTVLVDDVPVCACLILPTDAVGHQVTTIEGLARGTQLHPVQQAFVDHGAVQCGFCTPGMILAARALLETNPNPSDREIRVAIAGNLCRCTGYVKIVEAVKQAAVAMQQVPVSATA